MTKDVLLDTIIALTLGLVAGAGLFGGGGARYALEDRRGGLVGVVGLPSFSLVPDSSLFLFLGGGFGFSLVIGGELSFSSMKGFPVLSTELTESVEFSEPSGLGSGPKICEKNNRLPSIVLLRHYRLPYITRKILLLKTNGVLRPLVSHTFVLFTHESLAIILNLEHVKTKKVTLILLNIIKHTVLSGTQLAVYRKKISFNHSILKKIAMASKMEEADLGPLRSER